MELIVEVARTTLSAAERSFPRARGTTRICSPLNMMDNKTLVVVTALLAGCLCTPAVPDPPKGVVGTRKFASNIHDCNGAVAFSGAGALAPTKQDNGLLGFRTSLIDKSVGWSRESGEFTCYCPGLYQFTFSGSGKTAESRFVLKKKASNDENWTTVVSSGGGGGTNVALLDMEVGDKAAIFIEGGGLAPESEEAPVSTFSGIRIAKKQ
ncbi:hypothetical protein L9F63_018103 [Diploptera punctata]|uniref:C1q domain-containing protein n=1 Tax=Diploptera punctata TaxID=6984 RepID=A0AAD8EFU2_DIPPU|nr:hypothetical protein L9F63_018103 [Diploptera punctata]